MGKSAERSVRKTNVLHAKSPPRLAARALSARTSEAGSFIEPSIQPDAHSANAQANPTRIEREMRLAIERSKFMVSLESHQNDALQAQDPRRHRFIPETPIFFVVVDH
jgi:hypothetical protein